VEFHRFACTCTPAWYYCPYNSSHQSWSSARYTRNINPRHWRTAPSVGLHMAGRQI
jgi:hypothetical protein